MLVAFSAGYHHEHGVLKVTGGRRITMPAFYTFDRTRADPHIYPELYALPTTPPPTAMPQAPAPLSILTPAAKPAVWQPPGKWRMPGS